MTSSSELLVHIRRADPDRYFTSLFAPADKREALWLLYGFNNELARAREVASEPTLALIRLTWWRKVVDGAQRNHLIATPLTKALNQGIFTRADLAALIDAREAETAAIADFTHFMAYVRGTAGKLARVAGKLLGEDSDAVEDLGTAYGISGVLRAAPFLARQGRSLLPADGTTEKQLVSTAQALLKASPPRAAMAACLTAVYAKRDLGKTYRPHGLADKLAVLNAAVWGRV
ncbi:MAG: squalene/phytoene synthase family protein [Acidocella sp.]|nr:squalene/phytoene synthase family protein [Acidocella sp.]